MASPTPTETGTSSFQAILQKYSHKKEESEKAFEAEKTNLVQKFNEEARQWMLRQEKEKADALRRLTRDYQNKIAMHIQDEGGEIREFIDSATQNQNLQSSFSGTDNAARPEDGDSGQDDSQNGPQGDSNPPNDAMDIDQEEVHEEKAEPASRRAAQSKDPASQTHSGQLKRRKAFTRPTTPKSVSRPRKSITFNEVFNQGSPCQRILAYPSQKQPEWFFTLRCETHEMSFETMAGATSHIAHRHKNDTTALESSVIRAFGSMVVGCDIAKALKGNAAYEACKTRAGNAKPAAASQEAPRPSAAAGTGLIPAIGEVCCVSYQIPGRPTTQRYRAAAIRLPFGDFSQVGIRGDFASSLLATTVPQCYRVDDDGRILGWAFGYENNGALVPLREFPFVVLSDGPPGPSTSYAWFRAEHIVRLDPHNVPRRLDGLRLAGSLRAKRKADGTYVDLMSPPPILSDVQADHNRRGSASKVAAFDHLVTSRHDAADDSDNESMSSRTVC